MKYEILPSKNDFLLFTVMNLAGYNNNNGIYKFHPLRQVTREHFAKEINNEHVLMFGEEFRRRGMQSYSFQDAFVELQKMELGIQPDPEDSRRTATALGLLQKFRETTDFDSFYDSVALPAYEKNCKEVSSVVDGSGLFEVLDEAWELKPDFDSRIVPRPLVAPHCGNGPRIGDTAVAFIGPVVDRQERRVTFSDRDVLHLLGHETGHTYADIAWKEVLRVAKARNLEGEMEEFSRKQRMPDYNGDTVLVETMMRALQARYIDPKMFPGRGTPEERLIREHNRGFKHVFKFDQAIRRHKEMPVGTLAEDLYDYCERTTFED
jgi:hypothetical protein